jgi:GTP-binding protein EngB required for normal cell division
VDLPGYGYARGGRAAAAEFEALTRAFFEGRDSACGHASGREREARSAREASASGGGAPRESKKCRAALLLVDARHPGLDSDRAAWQWLHASAGYLSIVATKIDKLARGERVRALRELESVFEDSVLPVSAVTGEGLDELWTLIEQLANKNKPPRKPSPLQKRAPSLRRE